MPLTPSAQMFKSKFCQWAQSNLPEHSTRKFTNSLNNVLMSHLFESDKNVQIIIRNLVNSKKLGFSYEGEELLITPDSRRENLYIGVTMPSWDRGLRHICRDEHVYDVISWFFHFASQYVARSRMIDVIASINLVYGRTCDFRGHKMIKILEEKSTCKNSLELALKSEANPIYKKRLSSNERQLFCLIDQSNSLDPFVHRIHFNFLKSCKLLNSEFYEEAITSLDKTVDVIHQYARERMNINGTDNQRDLTLTAFEMSGEEKHQLARLYDIRNFFGGHPSMSKWWDFSEIFDEDIDQLFVTVRKLINRLIMHENCHRVVEKSPVLWSTWFLANAMILWDSVWFERIQKNIR
ncbi:hypothetical protein ABE504_22775 [Paenibacillus oryzisoli]|uniref:hypothetical protein n=1 Tax=Paenibacillus oryzisoli TaxID=1850517 RepID=UPI003D2DCFDD